MSVQPDSNIADLILTRDEVRAIDQAAMETLEIPGLLLMENAARGLVDQLHRVRSGGTITILCGPGNNGGDGLAAARLLAAQGHRAQVNVITAGKSLSADAGSNLLYLSNSGVPVEICEDGDPCCAQLAKLSSDDWVLESLLGTGVRGGLKSPFAEIVQAINASAANVLAVDVPSGLDCDTGTPAGECVRASRTVTFAGTKQGFLNPASREFTGEVIVAHIGIPQHWIRDWLQQYRS